MNKQTNRLQDLVKAANVSKLLSFSFIISISLTSLMNPASLRADDRVGAVFGATYGELAAKWWQWAVSTDAPAAPSGPTDCNLGQRGKVWFLAGSFGDPVERTCIEPIPAGKALFFPLVNIEVREGDCELVGLPGCTVEKKRQLADGIFSDLVTEDLELAFFGTGSYSCQLSATLDGVPVQNMYPIVRTQSPTFPLLDDEEAVADGIWIALPSLSKGEHTIHFTGAVCAIDDSPTLAPLFGVDVKYTLTVIDDVL